MRNNEKEYILWWRKAKEDLKWTEANIREKIYYGACFSAQQSAEKALKAFLNIRSYAVNFSLARHCEGRNFDPRQSLLICKDCFVTWLLAMTKCVSPALLKPFIFPLKRQVNISK